MKTIIAGGRHYRFTTADISYLDTIDISEVVSGGAPGADTEGESYAAKNKYPVKRFPADWKTHGKAAGPIRNKAMAEYADAVVLFPGGVGTASMHKEAVRSGLIIYDLSG